MRMIIDRIVIIGDGETAELARSVKALSVMQAKAQQMIQRGFIKRIGFWNITFEEWAGFTMKPIQTNREIATPNDVEYSFRKS